MVSQTKWVDVLAAPQQRSSPRVSDTARASVVASFDRTPILRLVGDLLVLGIAVVALYLASTFSYALFHGLAEIFSVVIGVSMFILAWNSRYSLESSYLLFLGIAYLFISATDLVHALADSAMGVFEAHYADLPNQFWIAARYVQSISLAISPLFLYRRSSTYGALAMLAAYTVVTALLFAAIFTGVFPVCFVEGAGLTPFKIASEYIICLVLLGSIYMHLRARDQFDDDVLRWIIISLLLTICSELVFATYASVSGLPNMIGHYLKIFAFLFIYKATIEVGLRKPHRLLYRNLKQSETALRQVLQEVQKMAVTDSLTGLLNRRHFFELAEHELRRAKRYARPLSIIMLDVDHFKQINDTYGHAVGDRVLHEVAQVCLSETRSVDVLGRYGGEEFTIMLPECEARAAREVAERLRQRIAGLSVDTAEGSVHVTASLGVASLTDPSMTLDALLSAADAALYSAKRGGRDNVVSA
jgi:diguanylate cyclase (GGDEF)-like protein